MRLTRSAFAAVLALLTLSVSPVDAQIEFFAGAGATFPLGTISSDGPFAGADSGWQGMFGMRGSVGSSGVQIGGRVFYGRNGYEGARDARSSLGGVTAMGMWFPTEGSVAPLLWAEAGLITHNYRSDTGGLAGGGTASRDNASVLAGGVGLEVGAGPLDVLVLGGYSRAFGIFEEIQHFTLSTALSVPVS